MEAILSDVPHHAPAPVRRPFHHRDDGGAGICLNDLQIVKRLTDFERSNRDSGFQWFQGPAVTIHRVCRGI